MAEVIGEFIAQSGGASMIGHEGQIPVAKAVVYHAEIGVATVEVEIRDVKFLGFEVAVEHTSLRHDLD